MVYAMGSAGKGGFFLVNLRRPGPNQINWYLLSREEANFPTRQPTMTPPYPLLLLTSVAPSCHLWPYLLGQDDRSVRDGFVQFKKRPSVPLTGDTNLLSWTARSGDEEFPRLVLVLSASCCCATLSGELWRNAIRSGQSSWLRVIVSKSSWNGTPCCAGRWRKQSSGMSSSMIIEWYACWVLSLTFTLVSLTLRSV